MASLDTGPDDIEVPIKFRYAELLSPIEIDRATFEETFKVPGSASRSAHDSLLLNCENFERVKTAMSVANSFDALCAALNITESPLLFARYTEEADPDPSNGVLDPNANHYHGAFAPDRLWDYLNDRDEEEEREETEVKMVPAGSVVLELESLSEQFRKMHALQRAVAEAEKAVAAHQLTSAHFRRIAGLSMW